MKRLIESLDQLPSDVSGTALSIGNFDGVHMGHKQLLRELMGHAERLQIPSLVVTFQPSPASILYPESAPPQLTWIERRAELLFHLGIDYVLALPTDRNLLDLSAETFFSQVLKEGLRCRAMVEGPNFRFGKDRQGDTQLLQHLCSRHSIAFTTVQPVHQDDEWVSSSRIRQHLLRGEIEIANRMLTEPYHLRGRVVRGAGRGTGLGFPTANLSEVSVLVPKEGVYAGRTCVDGQWYRVALNIGPNPTFGESHRKMEAHLLDTRLTLVDSDLEIELCEFLRDVRKFGSVEELREQIDHDLAKTRRVVSL